MTIVGIKSQSYRKRPGAWLLLEERYEEIMITLKRPVQWYPSSPDSIEVDLSTLE